VFRSMGELRSLDDLVFDDAGLVIVVAQHARTGALLTVGRSDRTTLERSLRRGELQFFVQPGTKRKKGKTSGNILKLVDLSTDCARDVVLARVEPFGSVCFTGEKTCFGEAKTGPTDALRRLDTFVRKRFGRVGGVAGAGPVGPDLTSGRGNPEEGDAPLPTAARTAAEDLRHRVRKLGAAVTELVVSVSAADRARSSEGAADVLFHLLVTLQGLGVDFDEVQSILEARLEDWRAPD
jgi:phosphoribosyl-ATP pyrophosphohydrolase/phosphoribosyl-AMP cyclohydrolase